MYTYTKCSNKTGGPPVIRDGQAGRAWGQQGGGYSVRLGRTDLHTGPRPKRRQVPLPQKRSGLYFIQL